MTLPSEGIRAKILEEAIGIVYRQGPRRITMRSLAEKLSYSPGTIYLYFRNKQELLKELALYGFDALGDAVAPAHALEDPFDAIAETARRYIDFGLEHHNSTGSCSTTSLSWGRLRPPTMPSGVDLGARTDPL